MEKEIRGKKVILREQREEDAPFFAYWFNQPRIMFQCGFEKPTDEEEMKICINVDHKRKDSVWFTITDLDGHILGGKRACSVCFLHGIKPILPLLFPIQRCSIKDMGQKPFV